MCAAKISHVHSRNSTRAQQKFLTYAAKFSHVRGKIFSRMQIQMKNNNNTDINNPLIYGGENKENI
jgi:hypothetical protein